MKGQGHEAALLTATLTRHAAAAVSVGTYWSWEPTATWRSALCRRGRLGGARRFSTHIGRRGAGHIVAADRLQLVVSVLLVQKAIDVKKRSRKKSKNVKKRKNVTKI